ncbi:sulfur carrier protein ThiS [Rheinheimera sp. YQF-2]|uniref:Sulfur carrier protein ThiS n=1 Tax=Rheinheimera lutimaris TaxID=2740584 RepID=A0A7Y5EL99_9GAMM|nr:sulfur carrier protein ThiS [Rheinheimera lutimaris]NRQ42988.1 sulfur carrier protein ThiS [Rheinheimera lutimaris]
MHIMLNDTPLQLAAVSTLAQLLQQQQLNTEGLAIAVNDSVIAKRLWHEYQLQNHDQIQLFQIVTGG